MSSATNFNAFPVAEILERFKPRASTIEASKEKTTSVELLDHLVNDGDFYAAIDFVAHAMPPQALVWWGCLCIWDFERNQSTPQFEHAMSLVIAWLQTPEEKQRRALESIDDKQFAASHPLRLLAKAAFMSHGSIVPAGLAAVKAPEFMFAVIGAGAIKLVAANSPAAEFSANSKQILRLAMEVVQGSNRWVK